MLEVLEEARRAAQGGFAGRRVQRLLVGVCYQLVEAACSEGALACQAQHSNCLDYGALLRVVSATERTQLDFLEQLRGCLEANLEAP